MDGGAPEPMRLRSERRARWWRDERVRAAVLGALVVGAGAWLGWVVSASADDRYYQFVDEVVTRPDLVGKHVLVHGFVVPGSIVARRSTTHHRFRIETSAPRRNAELVVIHQGVLPDLFKEGAEVVVSGRLRDDGVLEAARDGILAKCPGKYDVVPAGALAETSSVLL